MCSVLMISFVLTLGLRKKYSSSKSYTLSMLEHGRSPIVSSSISFLALFSCSSLKLCSINCFLVSKAKSQIEKKAYAFYLGHFNFLRTKIRF